MYSLLTAAAAALTIALALTPLCRKLAIRWGLLDQPDHNRKIHANPIPRIGGVPLVIAYLGSFVILLLFSFEGGDLVRGHLELVKRLVPASALVFATGLLDDLVGLKPWQKLLGQLAAAFLVFNAGVHLVSIGGHHLPIWCTLPATIVWLVACTNAVNLIDGVDGLAAGVGFFATVTTLLEALLQHNLGLAFATAPLAGALLGFLRYNFNPATIFLGDCGSLLIGFLLGCYALLWSDKSATLLGMTAPLMALSIPLIDTALAVVRRFLRCRPILGADRSHIHHKLLARGFTPRRVVCCMYVVCGISAALSLLASVAHEQFAGIILLLFCLGAWAGVQHLGYPEFDVARRMVLGGSFRRLLNAQLELATFRESLTAALTADQCWEVLHAAYSEFGFNEIKLKLGDRFYTHATGRYTTPSWTIHIGLSENEYLKLSHDVGTDAAPIIAPFADVVGSVLFIKAARMRALSFGRIAGMPVSSDRRDREVEPTAAAASSS